MKLGEELIIMAYGTDKNFMTPNVHKIDTYKNFAYEVSTGSAFKGGTLYGLTVVEYDEAKNDVIKREDLSKCYHSQNELDKAIVYLKLKIDEERD